MKAPAEYLAPHVFEARRPRRELQLVLAYDAALHALEQALADAEKYKYLLMRALRGNKRRDHRFASACASSSVSTPEPTSSRRNVVPTEG